MIHQGIESMSIIIRERLALLARITRICSCDSENKAPINGKGRQQCVVGMSNSKENFAKCYCLFHFVVLYQHLFLTHLGYNFIDKVFSDLLATMKRKHFFFIQSVQAGVLMLKLVVGLAIIITCHKPLTRRKSWSVARINS